MLYSETLKLQLCGGPSKNDLAMSLLTAFERGINRPYRVTFLVAPGQKMPAGINTTEPLECTAKVTGLSHEDGSGDSFMMRGILQIPYKSTELELDFEGYFNTKRRDGYINIQYKTADDTSSK